MTTPEARTEHAEDPSEGAEQPGENVEGRTPHSDDPAEGPDDLSRTAE